MGAAIKYTDRDVRENPQYYDMVVEYLEQYQGEFEFLVSCKMRVSSGIDLSVGMVRGVLNCMRADPRVGVMPEPVPMPEFDTDLVPEVDTYRRPRRLKPVKGICTRTDYHEHKYSDWNTLEFCPGKYEYDRPATYLMAATSSYALAVAKSLQSGLVHQIGEVQIQWYANPHKSGWHKKPDVIVRTTCGMPASLRNPHILDRRIMRNVNLEQSEPLLLFCGRCLPNG